MPAPGKSPGTDAPTPINAAMAAEEIRRFRTLASDARRLVEAGGWAWSTRLKTSVCTGR